LANLVSRGFPQLLRLVYTNLNSDTYDFREIPFCSATYEAVKTSMVIHHLVNTNSEGVVDDWTPILNTFKEGNRLLKGNFLLTPFLWNFNWVRRHLEALDIRNTFTIFFFKHHHR